MTQPDVTVEGLKAYAEMINYVWIEFSDEEVYDAAQRAIIGLEDLAHFLQQ